MEAWSVEGEGGKSARVEGRLRLWKAALLLPTVLPGVIVKSAREIGFIHSHQSILNMVPKLVMEPLECFAIPP